MNLSVLEEWIDDMRLPRGIASHFSPVRDLLTWLQVISNHGILTLFANASFSVYRRLAIFQIWWQPSKP
jgi:hypothetical protein